MGDASNIRWGYFDIIQASSSVNITKVPAKTNEFTLYCPIASSIHMEEYKLEDLVDFLKQEADYFNNLPDGSKLTHPSTLWYLEQEGLFAINFASVNSARLTTRQYFALDIALIPDTTTKGSYVSDGRSVTLGIEPSTIRDVISTDGTHHCESFMLLPCAVSLSRTAGDNATKTFCVLKDTNGEDVFLVEHTTIAVNLYEQIFIQDNIGPVFHLGRDISYDNTFLMHGTTTVQGGSDTSLVRVGALGVNYPLICVSKKSTGELAISYQYKNYGLSLKNPTIEQEAYFMKYDEESAIVVSKYAPGTSKCIYNCNYINFNKKIGGINTTTPIVNKKFTLIYMGDPNDELHGKNPLINIGALIDLEDNTTRYELLTGTANIPLALIGDGTGDPNRVYPKKFEANITYVNPSTINPLGIPNGKLFRVLMITNGSLHGKKLWRYGTTDPNDYFTIYKTGSNTYSFLINNYGDNNNDHLLASVGALFEIREEIPMTICSFGPCGENETDPVKATTIQTGYRHIYKICNFNDANGSAERMAEQFSYSSECLFYTFADPRLRIYMVKCLDTRKLSELGYDFILRYTLNNVTRSTSYPIGRDTKHNQIYLCKDSSLGNINYTVAFVDSTLVSWYDSKESAGRFAYFIGAVKMQNQQLRSSNYFSRMQEYSINGNTGYSTFTGQDVVEKHEDDFFIVGFDIPVGLEVYLFTI